MNRRGFIGAVLTALAWPLFGYTSKPPGEIVYDVSFVDSHGIYNVRFNFIKGPNFVSIEDSYDEMRAFAGPFDTDILMNTGQSNADKIILQSIIWYGKTK